MPNAAKMLVEKLIRKISTAEFWVKLFVEIAPKTWELSYRNLKFYLKYPYFKFNVSEYDAFHEKNAAIEQRELILKALKNNNLESIKKYIKNTNNSPSEKERIVRSIVALILTYRDLRTEAVEPLMDFLVEIIADCEIDSNIRSCISHELRMLLHPQIFADSTPYFKFYASLIESPLPDEIVNKTVSSLITLLRHADPSIRMNTITALQFRKDAYVVKAILEMLYDEDVEVKRHAILFFAGKGNIAAVEPLISLTRDKNIKVQNSAIWSLREIGDNRAIETLIDLIENDSDYEIKHSAIRALGIIDDNHRAIEFLTNLFKSANQYRIKFSIALSFADAEKENEDIIKFLSELLTHPNLSIRWEACCILAMLKKPVVIPFLMEFQTNPKYAYGAIWPIRVYFNQYVLFEDSLINALKNGVITTKKAIEALSFSNFVRNPKAYLHYLLKKKDKNFSYISFMASDDTNKIPDCCKENLKIGDEAIAILNKNNEKESIHAITCQSVKAAYWS